jgi:hypothetical protein
VTRTLDQPVPAVTLEDHPGRAPWWAGHGQLVVALERLPQAAYVWDDDDTDVTWDDITPERVWDAPFIGSGWTDVFCDLVALELVTGEPDGNDNYRTPYARLQLRDPGDGRYRTRTADGRLTYWAPGRGLAVWWHDEDGADWWQFAGRIATWRDSMLTPDVTIEAYATLNMLAGPLGRNWTAGADGDFLSERVAAIVAAAGYTGPAVRADLGDVVLTVPPPSDTGPLDELRRAAWSDGGIVYADTDDTLIVRDRRWRGGRSDQPAVPVLSDNVCDADVVAWDVVAADLDLRLAGRVTITNQAALTATATNPELDPSLVFTRPDADLWTTQAEGDALAVWLAGNRADARLAIGNADIHLHDRRFDYWHQVLDRRIGDWVRFVHEDTFTAPGDAYELWDVTLVLSTIRHYVTADTWTVQLATTPAVAYTAVELWDQTLLVWDDVNPLAVWR